MLMGQGICAYSYERTESKICAEITSIEMH